MIIRPSIELKNVSKSFYKDTEFEINALKSINLRFDKAMWTYIIGGNGSGKSTLLKVITGEILPDYGDVYYEDQKITLESNLKRSRIFYHIDQRIYNNLIGSMTIFENIVLASPNPSKNVPPLIKYKRKDLFEKIANIFQKFNLGLEDKLDLQVRFLSGGEQQVVVAAKVMYANPTILLIDEFTSALDQKLAPTILHILKESSLLNGETVIIITHDYSYIETTGDRVIILDKGRVKSSHYASENKLTKTFLLDKLMN